MASGIDPEAALVVGDQPRGGPCSGDGVRPTGRTSSPGTGGGPDRAGGAGSGGERADAVVQVTQQLMVATALPGAGTEAGPWAGAVFDRVWQCGLAVADRPGVARVPRANTARAPRTIRRALTIRMARI